MVYLGIFVFAACATFCLVQSEAPFVCPTCNGQGENADIDCDSNIEYKPCLMETDPVCLLVVTTPSNPIKMRVRYCASREFYKMAKARCNVKGNCKVAMCDTSGCRVELPSQA